MPENILPNHNRGERGIALLLALFAVIIVSAIGLSMMMQTDTETAINSNFRDQQSAYYAAAAGLEEARDRMRLDTAIADNLTLPTALPGSASGVLYVTNTGETIQPWNVDNPYKDTEICQELGCGNSSFPPIGDTYHLPAVSASNSYAANPIIPYKWTRINLKKNRSAVGTVSSMYVNGGTSGTLDQQVCWNGVNEIVSSTACAAPNYRVYVLTTLAVTPSGTRRMLQSEVTQDSLDIGDGGLPSALTIVSGGTAATTAWSLPNANGYRIEGNDHPGCGSTTTTSTPAAAIGVTNNIDVTNISATVPRADHYTNGVHSTPDIENVSTSLPDELQSVAALEAQIAIIKNKASQVFTSNQSGLSNPGTLAAPQIIYVDGDLTLGGSVTGYGVLVVRGTFSAGGNVGWRGMVLVVGRGIMLGNGGGSNEFDGAVVVAKTLDNLGHVLTSFGSPTFDWSGGGGNGINYSTGCIDQGRHAVTDYKIISSREMMY